MAVTKRILSHSDADILEELIICFKKGIINYPFIFIVFGHRPIVVSSKIRVSVGKTEASGTFFNMTLMANDLIYKSNQDFFLAFCLFLHIH